MENGPKAENGQKLYKNNLWPSAANGDNKKGPKWPTIGFGVLCLFFRHFFGQQLDLGYFVYFFVIFSAIFPFPAEGHFLFFGQFLPVFALRPIFHSIPSAAAFWGFSRGGFPENACIGGAISERNFCEICRRKSAQNTENTKKKLCAEVPERPLPKDPFFQLLIPGLLTFRKILVSVKFVSAILGPEMAAPILWAPGKMRSIYPGPT